MTIDAKFIHDKRLAIQPAAALPEHGRPPGSQLDDEGDDQHGNETDRQQNERAEKVNHLFNQPGKRHLRTGVKDKALAAQKNCPGWCGKFAS